MQYDVVVIGGGPAGMIAAGTAAVMGRKVLLLEKNEKLGKKLFITGKGRCNITNTADLEEFMRNIPKNSKFMYSAFKNLSNNDLIDLFKNLGLRTKIERGGRVFPESDKSSDVIKTLEKYLYNNKVDIRLKCKASRVKAENCCVTGVTLDNGEFIKAEAVIICTGGLSYPQTGSTGDGYAMASELGHNVEELSPSLVPLVSDDDFIKELQGLSLKNVALKLYIDGNNIYEDFGEMLFTHFGLSGPIVLSASFFAADPLKKKKKVVVCIDLKPALSEEELDKRIIRDFETVMNKQFKNSLDELLPKKLIPVIIKKSGINEHKEVHQVTREERRELVKLLKGICVNITATRPVEEAIVTSGGICLKEINPKTMESKLIKGLYFAGEVLDIDAFTGGYNLQIAFSTGYTAGINA